MKLNLLIIDDDVNFLNTAKKILQYGFEVTTSKNGKNGIEAFQQYDFQIVLLDMKLPDISGLDVLRRIKEINPFTPVIIITEYPDFENAVQAMKLGADDYIQKDFNFDLLKSKIEKLLETRDLKVALKYLKTEAELIRNEFIYASEVMRKVKIEIERIANLDVDVLLTGETGVGKDLLAYEIHKLSPRRDKNFVMVNLAGIEPNLVDSELFGTVKGAFTDAVNRMGKFEYANGGTIYLPEISEIPQSTQIKLLEFLQYKKITRIGSNKDIRVDVRLIFATNSDLEKLLSAGKLRDDFFYRISVNKIHIPPLRERRDDIIPLAKYFISKYSSQYGIRREFKLNDELVKAMLSYSWPGNVRELENMIRSSIRDDVDELRLEHFPYLYERISRSSSIKPYKLAEAEFRENYFKNLYHQANGDINRASKLSGISSKYLRRILKSLGIVVK